RAGANRRAPSIRGRFLAWSHFLRKTGSPLFRKMLWRFCGQRLRNLSQALAVPIKLKGCYRPRRPFVGAAVQMIVRRSFLQLAGAGIATATLPDLATAQAYPARPITMIVPYAAGGPTDTVGRTVAERMHAELGQPVVLENVA